MNNEPFVIERTYDAPAEKVWAAITDKDQMKQWYFDLAEFKAEVGFEFTFEGGSEEHTYLHLCKVAEVVTGKKLTYSWRYEGFEGNSFVTFELFPEESGTRLRLTHAGLETFPVHPDFARTSFSAGWDFIVGSSLKKFVETGTITKTVDVNAHAAAVWNVLTNNKYVKQWGSAFSEGTYVETDWREGSEVVWKDGDGNVGAKGVVKVNNPELLLSVSFWDDVNSTPDQPLGDYKETFTLTTNNGKINLLAESGPMPWKYVDLHTPMWEKAMLIIKSLAEG